MRPRQNIPPDAATQLRAELAAATSVNHYKRLLAVWLRVELDLTVEQIARATGLTPATIRCFHSRFLKQGVAALTSSTRGGRRRAYLSPQEEARLLTEASLEPSGSGELDVAAIKKAYEAAVQRPVPRSTIYRMLSRHGYQTPRGRRRRLTVERAD